MARDAPAEFVVLFHRAMAQDRGRAALDAFIKSLNASEADACVGAYFQASTDPAYHYSFRDRTSLGIFTALAFAAVDRGDPLYAVRFDALVHAEKSPWKERFDALERGQQGKLSTRAKQLRRALSPPQREILRMLPDVIRSGRSGEMEQYVDKRLDFHQAHACLLAYLEASLRYAPDNPRSLQVFVGISVYTIRKGDADFVGQYRTLIAKPGTTWSLRWSTLSPDQQEMVSSALRSRPLKVQLIEAGKAPGKVPVSVVTPSPGTLRADATRRDVTKPTKTTRDFASRFEKYMKAQGDRDAKLAQRELTEFIFRQSREGLPGLRECMASYVQASAAYPLTDPRSLEIFWGIASLLINKGQAYEALKLNELKNTPRTIVAQRFAALPEDRRTTLENEIARLVDRKKRRILDDVKFAYWKEHHADATVAALREFEPDLHPAYRETVRAVARECDRTYNLRDAQAFTKAFDAFADVMTSQTYPLVVVPMIKWVRDLKDLTPRLRSELYWYAMLSLQISALTTNPEAYDKHGLSDEEKEFFLEPSLVAQGYRYDFEKRLEYVWWKRASQKQLRDVSRAHLLLLYFAEKLGFMLVTMDKAEEIRNHLVQLKREKSTDFEAIEIPVNSRFTADWLTLGATVGDLYIVWWDPKRSEVYVEMQGFGRVLFAVDSYMKLGKLKREDDTYGKIWRDNQHLLQVIPFFFEVMGYLLDLVTDGFAGLVASVLTDMMVEVVAEKAGLDEKDTMALSMVAHMGHGHMLNRMNEGNGTRVLLDLDDLEELAEGAKHGPAWQTELLGTRERANGIGAKALDTGDGGRAGGGSHVVEDVNAPEVPKGRPDEPAELEGSGTKTAARGEGSEDLDVNQPKAAVGGESGAFDIDQSAGMSRGRVRRKQEGSGTNLRGEIRGGRGRARRRTKPRGDVRGTKRKGIPPAKRKRTAIYTPIESENHRLLRGPKKQGFVFKRKPRPASKTLGTRWEHEIGGRSKWDITGPDGKTKFEADFLAEDPETGGIKIGEAKASAVSDPGKTGHYMDPDEKVDALGRATSLTIQSKTPMRLEIGANASEIEGVPAVAPEAFFNYRNQLLAEELMKNHRSALTDYFKAQGRPRGKFTLADVQELVDRQVIVTDIEWGRFGKPPDPTPKGPPAKGPTKGGPKGSPPKRQK